MKSRFLPVSLIACALLFAGCVASAVIAQSVTGVAEVAAGNLLQQKALTVTQLSQLANDLGAFPNTPLPPQDNQLIANLISELTRQKAASLTGGSAVDALNQAIQALTATSSPTAAAGIAWADLQDVVAGLKREVIFATANPGT